MGLNDQFPGRAKDYSVDFGRILGLGTVTVHLDTVHITLEHDESCAFGRQAASK